MEELTTAATRSFKDADRTAAWRPPGVATKVAKDPQGPKAAAMAIAVGSENDVVVIEVENKIE